MTSGSVLLIALFCAAWCAYLLFIRLDPGNKTTPFIDAVVMALAVLFGLTSLIVAIVWGR